MKNNSLFPVPPLPHPYPLLLHLDRRRRLRETTAGPILRFLGVTAGLSQISASESAHFLSFRSPVRSIPSIISMRSFTNQKELPTSPKLFRRPTYFLFSQREVVASKIERSNNYFSRNACKK